MQTLSPYNCVSSGAAAYNQKTFPRKRASILSVACPTIVCNSKHRAPLTSQGYGHANACRNLQRYGVEPACIASRKIRMPIRWILLLCVNLSLSSAVMASGSKWESFGWEAKANDGACMLQSTNLRPYFGEDLKSRNELLNLTATFYQANIQMDYPHISEDFGFGLGETVLILTVQYYEDISRDVVRGNSTTEASINGLEFVPGNFDNHGYFYLGGPSAAKLYKTLASGASWNFVGRDSNGRTHTREVDPYNFTVSSAMFEACNEAMASQQVLDVYSPAP